MIRGNKGFKKNEAFVMEMVAVRTYRSGRDYLRLTLASVLDSF